jgi:hypothetical protein
MAAVRRGGMVYYSLGGSERQVFANTYLTMSRCLQQIFFAVCCFVFAGKQIHEPI